MYTRKLLVAALLGLVFAGWAGCGGGGGSTGPKDEPLTFPNFPSTPVAEKKDDGAAKECAKDKIQQQPNPPKTSAAAEDKATR